MDTPHWFALTVRPRHENTVGNVLLAKSIESYVPMYKERRRWSDRTQTIELPVFSNYVFCRFSYRERLKVLRTPSVLSIVGFGGRPSPLRDEEIGTIKSMVACGLPIAPWQYVSAGDHVRISCGAMAGLEGILVEDKSSLRVVVNVELLGRAIAMEIDRDWVAPLALQQWHLPR